MARVIRRTDFIRNMKMVVDDITATLHFRGNGIVRINNVSVIYVYRMVKYASLEQFSYLPHTISKRFRQSALIISNHTTKNK